MFKTLSKYIKCHGKQIINKGDKTQDFPNISKSKLLVCSSMKITERDFYKLQQIGIFTMI